MDSAAQGAELLASFVGSNRPRLLDVGCGGGHFYHSLARRGLAVDYFGLDSSPKVVAQARRAFAELGLDPTRILLGAVEDLRDEKFELAAFINVLSFRPDYREPVDRVLDCGVKALVVRDNFGPKTEIRWETDGFLDDGYNHLKGYWNRWSTEEFQDFLATRGFWAQTEEDRRTRGQMELVVGKPYYWSWLVAQRF
jgi:SAM-dependent methyltransferase